MNAEQRLRAAVRQAAQTINTFLCDEWDGNKDGWRAIHSALITAVIDRDDPAPPTDELRNALRWNIEDAEKVLLDPDFSEDDAIAALQAVCSNARLALNPPPTNPTPELCEVCNDRRWVISHTSYMTDDHDPQTVMLDVIQDCDQCLTGNAHDDAAAARRAHDFIRNVEAANFVGFTTASQDAVCGLWDALSGILEEPATVIFPHHRDRCVAAIKEARRHFSRGVTRGS